jgi:hypothetical protein
VFKYVFRRFSCGFVVTVYQHWQCKICDQLHKDVHKTPWKYVIINTDCFDQCFLCFTLWSRRQVQPSLG